MAYFPAAQLKSININMKTREIAFRLTATLSDENFEEAEKLQRFLDSESQLVALKIEPAQMAMPDVVMTSKAREGG